MKKEFIILAFFVFCVPIRSLLVYIAFINRTFDSKADKIQLLAVFTFIVSIYWLFISISGLLSDAWWNPYRIIHAMNYLIFSGLVYLKYKHAYIILLLDLIFGVTVFILQNYDFMSTFVHKNIIDYIKRYSIAIS